MRLVWVRSDAASLRHRLELRRSDRDTGKLARFDEFVAGMLLDRDPAVPHVRVDNRLSAASTIEAQLRAALRPS
ncbi:hypothetical protein [Pseudonocardia bannensis]|uniref:hypothetical protein n=1 Tax=Pseudonocardia bannensis TaxID=630973 RepID=UPI00146C71E2|nr:hypothetical protein [Pseudonocardia bannensis]